MKRALPVALVCSLWLASGASAQEEPATGEGAGSSFVDGLEWQVMASGCRAMADDLGSRVMIRSEHWAAMRDAGVHVAAGLPIGNPLLRPFKGRIDLRNHRKIVVIDDHITCCGSQNCADPVTREAVEAWSASRRL